MHGFRRFIEGSLVVMLASCSGEVTSSIGQRDPPEAADTAGIGHAEEGAMGNPRGGAGGGAASVKLDRLVRETMAKAHVPGLAACIVKGGRVAWCNGYGLADVEARRPVTMDTAFLMGSVSKTVTVATLMQLWERGAFDLDDDIGLTLPFQVEHPWYDRPITYRGLLTHTASIRDNWAVIADFYHHEGEPHISLAEVMAGYFDPGGAYYDPQHNFVPAPPGTLYEYANMGVALTGYAAEALSGTDFAELSRKMVIEPLGMERTSWRISDFAPEDLAMPYAWKAGAYVPYGHYTFADYPDGNLRTTAPDLARFLLAIIAGGVLDGVRILEEATVAEMLRAQVPHIKPMQGLIFYHIESGGGRWTGHDGLESGAGTQMYYRPADGLGFVLLLNGDWGMTAPLHDIREALIKFGETLP